MPAGTIYRHAMSQFLHLSSIFHDSDVVSWSMAGRALRDVRV